MNVLFLFNAYMGMKKNPENGFSGCKFRYFYCTHLH